MLFLRRFSLQCLIAALGVITSYGGVAAEPLKSISPFASSSFDRTVYGDDHAFDLSLRGHRIGSANAFVGVDGLSGEEHQFLTSGLLWRSGVSTSRSLRLSALQTERRGSSLYGAQTLLRAANQLDLGSRWYMPTLSTEIAQVSNNDRGAGAVLSGRAMRIGVMEEFGSARFNLGYFQADPQFNALGSDLVAGERGLGLETTYDLADRWHLSHELKFRQAMASRDNPGVVQKWVFAPQSDLTDVGRPWQFSAHLGNRLASRDRPGMPIALKFASPTARWRRWRLNTSVGWYGRDTITPLDLPVAGTLWQVSASRGLNIAGLRTELSPSFAFGGSRYENAYIGSRAGLSLGFSQLSDNVDLSVDYLSRGWGRTPALDDDLQMTVNFTQRTSAVMPRLRSMVGRLRLPWQPRLR